MTLRVLICDDDEFVRKAVAVHLNTKGHEITEVADGHHAIDLVVTKVFDAMLLDLQMPGMDGLETLRRMRDLGDTTPVLVMTAFGDIDTAIEATRLGAFAYLTKPLNFKEMFVQLDKAVETRRLRDEVRHLRELTRGRYAKLVGESAAMNQVFEHLKRLETVSAVTVLINGESGTGKDLVAQAIHTQGPRAEHPFMEIDCAALPEQLIEAELFGYEKGAFTDAHQTKRGLFEVAGHGTIFLDEIGEMALGTQAKLLRALENRSFKRVGGVAQMPFSAAVLAATNRDLYKEVQAGRFREDLYFRLNVIPIDVPPLRDRSGDIRLLVHHFLARFNHELGKQVNGLSDEALSILERYDWPGNVRELRNLVERLVILEGSEGAIQASQLPPEIRFRRISDEERDKRKPPVVPAIGAGVGPKPSFRFILPDEGIHLEEIERDFIRQALQKSAGGRTRAAKLLGISRHALRYRMQKFSLEEL